MALATWTMPIDAPGIGVLRLKHRLEHQAGVEQ